MKIIKLPPILPGGLDLTEIDQQLQAGKAQLDWSEVVSAQQKYLEVLLVGLDLSDNAGVLGIDGAIADNVMDEIIRFDKTSQAKKRASAVLGVSPISDSPNKNQINCAIALGCFNQN